MKAEHIKEFQALDTELAELRRRLLAFRIPGVLFRASLPERVQPVGDGEYGARVQSGEGFVLMCSDIIPRLEKGAIEERITAIQARQKELDR